MKNYRVWRGLTAVFTVVLSLVIGLTSVALVNEGSINQFLNIGTDSVSGDEGTIYYSSKYGELSDENLNKLKSDIDAFIATEVEEGAVMLSNDGTLPLDKTGLNISLFGSASYNPIYKNASAGGILDENRKVDLKEAFEKIGYKVNETLYSAYANGTAVRESKAGSGSSIGEEPLSFYTQNILDSCSNYKDAAIVVFARAGGEGFDLNVSDADGVPQLSLHQQEKDLLNLIKEQGFTKIIVLINSGFAMEVSELKDYGVNACIWMGTPGLTGFNGIANIINGTVSPSGRLVDTYATNSLSSPAMMNFGDYHFVNAPELNYVVNAEGIYVGYKYYETRYEDCVLKQGNASSKIGSSTNKNWNYADEVTYTFGYGLSYTTFTQELLSCEYDDKTDLFTIKVKVTNTGDYAGKDVVEVYLQSPYTEYDKQYLVEKTAIQLVGYEKTSELNPGESEEITVTVDRYLCASYDCNNVKGYILDAGDYYFAIGSDAHNALNNVLAAKGYTTLDGMTENGDAEKTYTWTIEELDTTSYRNSKYTDNEVTNVFVGDYAVDINDFYDTDVVTYLSRQDWVNTYPKTYDNLTASDALLKATSSKTYTKSSTAKKVSDFVQGVDAGIDFIDLTDWSWNDERWDTFLNQLTIEELATAINNNTGVKAIESIGKPANRDADGPDGYAFNYTYGDKSTASCYAGQIVAASSWNKELIAQLGDFYAEECFYTRGNEVFGPGNNLHRTPYGGRNFEYYTEDSVFAYLTSAVQCKAMQEKGLIAAPKHFCANDQETNRSELCTFMTEQRMRQEPMKAFEGAFTVGDAGGVMGMMGRIGVKADMVCYPLITTVLRGEWDFTGMVITDAGGQENEYQPTVECVLAGVDAFCLTSRSSVLINAIKKNDDGDLLEALRQINKRFYYTRAHSNLINGLSKETVIVDKTPWWIPTMYVIDGTIGLVLIWSVVMFYMTAYKKKK